MRQPGRSLLALCAGLLATDLATAGGPLVVQTNGEPFVWTTPAAIQYRTDSGPLSSLVNETEARQSVGNMFDVWQDVVSANISYSRAGAIQSVAGFSGGDVNTAAEYDAVEGSCLEGDQNPIVYDATGEIFEDVVGDDAVIGFAGPCGLDIALGLIVSGQVVMNGLFRDGIENATNFELTEQQFNAVFIHEFGHFSGLDHSQINVECGFGPCGTDKLAGLPTMFPFLVTNQQASLSVDDIGWISKLYPAPGGGGYAVTHGLVAGTVYFSDGESHAQFVNVVARRVDAPGGANESLTTAASSVSGNRFRVFSGNSINEPDTEPLGPFGSQIPTQIGQFEIPLPPGNYRIEVEAIDPAFVGGSSVGGEGLIAMPGTAPAPISVTVTAGTTQPDNDVILIGTPPRFDDFESP